MGLIILPTVQTYKLHVTKWSDSTVVSSICQNNLQYFGSPHYDHLCIVIFVMIYFLLLLSFVNYYFLSVVMIFGTLFNIIENSLFFHYWQFLLSLSLMQITWPEQI